MIRPVTTADAPALASIYNHYITTSTVTFETEPLTDLEMQDRVKTIGTAGYPWLVYTKDTLVIGYAYANCLKARAAYGRSVETSVYVETDSVETGVGTALYAALIHKLKEMGFHTAVAILHV